MSLWLLWSGKSLSTCHSGLQTLLFVYFLVTKRKCIFTVEGSSCHPRNPVFNFSINNGGMVRYSASPVVIQCEVHMASYAFHQMQFICIWESLKISFPVYRTYKGERNKVKLYHKGVIREIQKVEYSIGQLAWSLQHITVMKKELLWIKRDLQGITDTKCDSRLHLSLHKPTIKDV